jgi:hypothetical protein
MRRVVLVALLFPIAGCADAPTPAGVESPTLSVTAADAAPHAHLYVGNDDPGIDYVGRSIVVASQVATPVELCFESGRTVSSLVIGPAGETAVIPLVYEVNETFPRHPEPGERFLIAGQSRCDGYLVFTLERLPGRPN